MAEYKLGYTGDQINAALGKVLDGVPYNLLDNSDFTNAVNQRGASSYTGSGYTVDRWYMYANNSELTATPSSNGLTLVNSGSSTYNIIQRLPFDLSGKTVTFAVCDSTGSVTILSGVIPTGDVSSNTSMLGSANSNDGSYYISIYKRSSTQVHEVRINVFAGRSTTIRWAALYEGSYTADTLPAYVPKGYAAELAECQRDYRRGAQAVTIGKMYTAGSIFSLRFPQMRIHPTINILEIVSQGWGNVDKNNYTQGWVEVYGSEYCVNFTSSITDDVGKTVVVRYECIADM